MKKIRKTAKNKIQTILEKASIVQVFTFRNEYKGEEVELTQKDVKLVLEDIQEGQANLYKLDDKSYKLQYAGKCHWKITA